jgi:Na+/H+ antiporter NhaD/arsenite permease-like protein
MTQETVAIIIFLISYGGIAIGSFPGLAIDRTGIALLGAIAMLAAGVLNEIEAFDAINLPTILLLYALMVLSAQFTISGFYTKVARTLTRFMGNPKWFLFLLMITSALLSAFLVNDIVCLAFTPVVCVAVIRASLNPVPFLIGLACASNIGSAATIMGNPQNMLIGQVGGLHFWEYLIWCTPPTVLALCAAYGIVVFLYRGKWQEASSGRSAVADEGADYNLHQTQKGLILTAILVIFFFTPIRRELAAMAVAGILLCSRKITTRSLLGLVDWHLITLFCGLFVIIAGLVKYGIPVRGVALLSSVKLDINSPFDLSIVALFLSNIVSNVPAVMLLLSHIDMSITQNLYILALVSTFAGNCLIIGSIANLITFEQAKKYDIFISFGEHAKVGFPVTAVSIIMILAWKVLLT